MNCHAQWKYTILNSKSMRKELRMKRLFGGLFLIVALVSAVFLVGLARAQASVRVAVTEKDFSIALANTQLSAGTPITFVITNDGPSKHELVLERAGDVDKALEVDG